LTVVLPLHSRDILLYDNIYNFKEMYHWYISRYIHILKCKLQSLFASQLQRSEIHSSVELSSSTTMPGGQRLKLPNLLSQCIAHDGLLLMKSSSIPLSRTPSHDDVHACLQYTMAHPSSALPIGVPIVHGTSVVDTGVFVIPGRLLMQQQQPFAEHSSVGADGRPWNGSSFCDRRCFVVTVANVHVGACSSPRIKRRIRSNIERMTDLCIYTFVYNYMCSIINKWIQNWRLSPVVTIIKRLKIEVSFY
jgi:hypothetical protein